MPVREFQHEHRRSLLAVCWMSVYSSASVEESCVGWCAEVAQHKQLCGGALCMRREWPALTVCRSFLFLCCSQRRTLR